MRLVRAHYVALLDVLAHARANGAELERYEEIKANEGQASADAWKRDLDEA